MKNQKGFTLVELLVTIGLMIVIGVIIAGNLSSLFSRQEDESIEEFENTLAEAACVYIDLSEPSIKEQKKTCKNDGICKVRSRPLIDNGLLEEDFINPITKKKITGQEEIEIRYENGEKICTYHAG